jgi:hypothetical protein
MDVVSQWRHVHGDKMKIKDSNADPNSGLCDESSATKVT